MIWMIFTAVFILFLYRALKKPLKYWHERGVKQTRPLIIFGDALPVMIGLKSSHEWVQELYNRCSKNRYYGLYTFHKPCLVIKDTELLKKIAVKDFDHFTDHRAFVGPEVDPIWGNNLFSLKGHRWRTMRNTLSPSFTSSKMRQIFSLMKETVEDFISYFEGRGEEKIEVDMKDVCTRFANDVIATTAFGLKVDSFRDSNNEFFLLGKGVVSFEGIIIRLKFFGYLLLPWLFKLFKIPLFPKRIGRFFKNIVETTIKTREEKGIVRPDMIHILMEAKKGTEKTERNELIDNGLATDKRLVDTGSPVTHQITNEDITAQALLFFFAGFESVSTMICFAMYELAVNPDIQNKLRDEINETISKCDNSITYDSLLGMKYMDMVISETLRKWPAPVATDRVCTKQYQVEPEMPGEKTFTIEEGTMIHIPTFGLHRDPEYFPDPEKFDPERFSDERKNEIKPYTYLPFGLGPRICLGSRFALMEAKILIFYILSRYEIVPSTKLLIPLQISRNTLTASAKGGFWFNLNRL